MNEQTTSTSSYLIDVWKCPKCGANNKFNPNICTSCNYSKIPPIQVLPPQSRLVWEKISYALIGVLLLLQIAYAVSMFMGFGLNLLFGIGGEFLDTALQIPDMLLYSHFVTAGICVGLAVWNGLELFFAIKNKEKLTGALHRSAVANCIGLWMFPVVNILTDMVVTSIKKDGVNLRPFSAYDLFDMGISIVVPLIITAVCLAIIYVNDRFAPNDNLNDEE